MLELIRDYQFLSSTIFVTTILLIRWLLARLIKRKNVSSDGGKQRWLNSINNVASLFIFIGLIFIWITELRYFALSMAAFAVAVVVATREFIQCILGALFIAATRPFQTGDWIEIGDYAGEVVSSDWFTTKLLEVDLKSKSYSYTGKTLTLPNNLFASKGVHNLNFMRRYVAHSFSIMREAEWVNPFEAKTFLLEKAEQCREPFHEVAQRYNALIEKRLGIPLSGPSADVRIGTTEIAKNVFNITVFCPTEEAVRIEQELTESFFKFWYEAQKNAKLAAAKQSTSGLTATPDNSETH